MITEEKKQKLSDEYLRVVDLVIADMKNRDKIGYERYGSLFNPYDDGKDIFDAYIEALDVAVYLRSYIHQLYGR